MGGLAGISSAEFTATDIKGLEGAAPSMTSGMAVYIAALPTSAPDDLVLASLAARRLGLEPVPHLVARNFESQDQFADIYGQLVTEAKVSRALVLAGDRSTPAGPFEDAASLLRSGLFGPESIGRVAFGVYPEGHPRVDKDVLDAALLDKIALASLYGLIPRLITQICFDADQIIRFVRSLRDRDIMIPLRFGVVGPTKLTTLAKYAAICGVGPSLKAIVTRPRLGGQLFTGYTPGSLIETVMAAQEAEPTLSILGPHFFTFGSLKSSINWMRQRDVDHSAQAAKRATI